MFVFVCVLSQPCVVRVRVLGLVPVAALVLALVLVLVLALVLSFVVVSLCCRVLMLWCVVVVSSSSLIFDL